jgi:hypothetical protein
MDTAGNKTDNQDFKNFLNPDNLLKIVIALSILLFSFSIFYRYVFYLPNKEALQKQEEENRKKALEECLSDAEEVYLKCWERHCEAFKKSCSKYPDLYTNCPEVLKTGKCEFLPKERANDCYKQEEDYKNECFKKFK